MAYKTLFTIMSDPTAAAAPIAQAAALANLWDAHLDVLALGIDRTQTGYYYAGANAMVLQQTLQRAQEEANELEVEARKVMGEYDVRWGVDSAVVSIADMGRHVAARARFSDLAVMAQPYGDGRGIELEPALEAALFEGNTPVLMVPPTAPVKEQFERIVVAWNESDEALNAVRSALPLLQAADRVTVTIIDPPTHGPERSDPGGALSQWLSRHDVHADVAVLAKTMPRVSDVIARQASDLDADLVVMGAYGHSRFREAILGGATRGILENAALPVFLAH